MVGESLESPAEREPAIDVFFEPQHQPGGVPVEVLRRQELMERMPERHMRNLQRARFHQLIVCTEGSGTHHVDFSPFVLSTGTVLRIRPGQVQEFEHTPTLVADMVIWPIEHHPQIASSPIWYPGSGVPSAVQLEPAELQRINRWVAEMRIEQERFEQSPVSAEQLRTMLRLVLTFIGEHCGTPGELLAVPQAYLDLRRALEERLFSRPSVSELGSELGYSTRTLDRACETVTNQTAKQVVDERINLEVRRLLADTSRPIAEVRDAFGFIDPSNFTKFVRRHLGQTPGDFRHAFERVP